MSTIALQASGYVNEVRTNTGKWPDWRDVCNAVDCSIEVAERAIKTVQHWWESSHCHTQESHND